MTKKEQDKEVMVVDENNKKTTVTRTFEKLKEFDGIYGALLDDDDQFEHTKLGYAMKRFSDKNLKKIFKTFRDELDEIQIEHALTDEKTGAILYTEKDAIGRLYKYNKEGLKKVMQAEKELESKINEKEFEVEPYICKDIGSVQLTQYEVEVLTGLVI